MIREVQSETLGLRVMGFKHDLTSGTPTATIGLGDIASTTDNGSGDYTINLKTPFRTTAGSNVAVCPIANADASGSINMCYTNSISAARFLMSGDAVGHVLMAGVDSLTLDRALPLSNVKTTASRPVLMGFKVTGTGTAVIDIGSNQATLTDNGTGDYTLTFRNAFGRIPVVAGCCGTANLLLRVISATATSVNVKTVNTGGTATDSIFYLFVLGHYKTQEDWGRRTVLHTTQRNPRMLVFNITDSGTATVSLGAQQGTLTDNGTGDYTITFTKAFRRAPIVAASAFYNGSNNSFATIHSDTDSTRVRVLRMNSTGPAAQDGNVSIWVLGFDDSVEY